MTASPSLIALVLVLALSVVWDLRTRRIPNWLTVGACGAALGLRAVQGFEPLGFGALGLVLGLAMSLPLVFAGGLGGGDAKLLAAVGAFLGPGQLISALLAMALAGGVLTVVVATRRGVMYETLRNTWRLTGQLVGLGPESEPRRTLGTAGALTIPYAVPIAIGALGVLIYG